MSKISSLTALTSTQPDDVMPIVDVHDTTMATSGTTKKITVANFLKAILGGAMFAGPVTPAVVALTDAATIAVSAAAGNYFCVTLGGNRTMGVPSGPADGQTVIFEIIQDNAGSRTLTWTSGAGGYAFGGSTAPVLSTAAGATDLAAFSYSLRKNRWLYRGAMTGF